MSKKIIIGDAGGKKVGFDRDLLLATRLLIQADSGGGKSWLIRALLEQIFGEVQTIVLDPEGEFATLREKFPFVLVGRGGETPADVRSAGLVATRLLELRASAVCDLYELKSHLRHAWVRAFIDALIEAPKEIRTPCIVVVDEAHMFCPEKGKGESEAYGSMVDLCTRGRKRGLCAVFATQRLGMLSKDASSQLQNRLIGPTFEDINRKRAAEVLGIPKSEERDFFHEIQLLEPGYFFALGRAISRERILVHVREVETTHPKAFEKHTAPLPPAPDKIKALLPKLADLPKEAEERARTEQDFRREIRELQQKLKAAEKSAPDVRLGPSHAGSMIANLRAALGEAMKIIAKIKALGFEGSNVDQARVTAAIEKASAEISRLAAKAIESRQRQFDQLKKEAERVLSKLQQLIGSENVEVAIDVRRQEPIALVPAAAPRRGVADVALHGVTPAQSKILRAAAEFHAIGIADVSKKWLAARSGASHKSSSYGNNLGALRSGGLIDYRNGNVFLTADGIALAGPQNSPLTAAEMAASCKALLTPAQQKIFDVLYQSHPVGVARETLAGMAGASPASSSFGNNLGAMRSAGMIDYGPDKTIQMQKWIFLEGAA